MGHHFDILYSDPNFVVIDKPETFHVHKPEAHEIRVDPAKLVLQQLRDQLGCHVYPVHRLDVPTSGCLLMALDSETASRLGLQLRSADFQKIYRGVARGWAPEAEDIRIELKSEDRLKLLAAHTRLKRRHTVEVNDAVGLTHPTARYSLLDLEPVTGRFHQIRRHLNHISHPLIGDGAHGDRHHNRFFAARFAISGLCLRAFDLRFTHPYRPEERIHVRAPWNEKWQQIHTLFGLDSAAQFE